MSLPRIQTREVPDKTAPNGTRTLYLVQLPPPAGLTTFSSETLAQAFCTYISGSSDPTMVSDLETFHETYGAPIFTSPAIPPKERQDLRRNLVESEAGDEFLDAWKLCEIAGQRLANAKTSLRMLSSTSNTERRQLEETVAEWTKRSDEAMADLADAIADSIYVLIGTALEYGLPLCQVWNQVQNSNMAKLWTWEEVEKQLLPRPTENPDETDTVVYATISGHTYQRVLTVKSDRCYVVKNDLGKVMKPPSWTPPAIVDTIRTVRMMTQMKEQGIMGVPAQVLEEFSRWQSDPTFVPSDPFSPVKLTALQNQGVKFITEEEFYNQLGFKDTTAADGTVITAQESFYAWRRSTGDQTV